MNCPGHVQIFKHGLKSYRELPIKIAEFGCVHRYEPSGALHGLMRVRGSPRMTRTSFVPRTRSPSSVSTSTISCCRSTRTSTFEDVHIKLATRPEKRVGADELWDKAETR